MINKDSELYVFKDYDGYFIGMKGTSIVRKITKQEYQEYRLVYEEWEYTKGDDKIEETNSNDINRSNTFSRMYKARR